MEYQDQDQDEAVVEVEVEIEIEVRPGLESILRIVTGLFVSIENRSESKVLFPVTLINHMETSSRNYVIDLSMEQ